MGQTIGGFLGGQEKEGANALKHVKKPQFCTQTVARKITDLPHWSGSKGAPGLAEVEKQVGLALVNFLGR